MSTCGSTEGRTSSVYKSPSAMRNGQTGQPARTMCGSDALASEYQASPAGKISEAASHLRVALLQAHPHDDQIILEHVREALKLLEAK